MIVVGKTVFSGFRGTLTDSHSCLNIRSKHADLGTKNHLECELCSLFCEIHLRDDLNLSNM